MAQSTSPAACKPILVALDLSDRSSPCLSQGCEMAAKLGQPLVLVHVVHETAENTGMYRRYQKASDTTPIHDIARTMLQERVAAFRASHDGLEQVCDIQLVVVGGIPETRILELAGRYDAGMVVMCSHNRRGLSHWLYGSVTESVVRNAVCPVVVVGREEKPFAPVTFHRPPAPETTAVQGA